MKRLNVLWLTLLAVWVSAQTVLDPTMSGAYPAYPAYSDYSCGGVTLNVLDERTNEDGTVDAMVKAKTVCSSGGRGAQPRHRLACSVATFAADRYTVLNIDRVLTATWLQRTGTAVVCPGL
jgi:hypothetical protein